MRIRRLFLVPCCVVLPLLTGCGGALPRVQMQPEKTAVETTSDTLMSPAERVATDHYVRMMMVKNAVRLAQVRDTYARLLWDAAALKNAEAVNAQVRAEQATSYRPPATAPAPLILNAGSCEQLVAKYFPDDTAWAERIAQRESHCTAGAVNNEGCDTSGRTNSHALGVFQLCYPLHQAAFDTAGCNHPLELECGIRAARALYDSAGRGPWGG